MKFSHLPTACSRAEFVGTAVLDTIALVIAGADEQLIREMALGTSCRALGVFSSRTGAAGQLTAIDDAVKATNTEVLSVELPRDTKGWGGHGNYVVVGGKNVSDVRRCMEIALERTNFYAGELYISAAGHLEFTYTANAGDALVKAFGAKKGEAFGFLAGSPAAIGLVMADTALKAADVSVVKYATPDRGPSHSNEVILAFSGEASAVREAVTAAERSGLELLVSLGSYPETPSKPWLAEE